MKLNYMNNIQIMKCKLFLNKIKFRKITTLLQNQKDFNLILTALLALEHIVLKIHALIVKLK